MKVRKGREEDFIRLDWGWYKDYPTQNMFINKLHIDVLEFWVVEEEGIEDLLGEFHIIWNSPDKDEADGNERVYLCVFRVHPGYRGKGIGKALKDVVFERLREEGKKEATIGVKKDLLDLKKMYLNWGFTSFIKNKKIDHHNVDEEGNYKKTAIPIQIYLKNLDSCKD